MWRQYAEVISMLNKQEFKSNGRELRVMRDVMIAYIKQVSKELKIGLIETKVTIDEEVVSLKLNSKFDYLDGYRWSEFTVISVENDKYEITYTIYSYDEPLRSRMIRVLTNQELKSFISLVLKQDLVLETDSNIVE